MLIEIEHRKLRLGLLDLRLYEPVYKRCNCHILVLYALL